MEETYENFVRLTQGADWEGWVRATIARRMKEAAEREAVKMEVAKGEVRKRFASEIAVQVREEAERMRVRNEAQMVANWRVEIERPKSEKHKADSKRMEIEVEETENWRLEAIEEVRKAKEAVAKEEILFPPVFEEVKKVMIVAAKEEVLSLPVTEDAERALIMATEDERKDDDQQDRSRIHYPLISDTMIQADVKDEQISSSSLTTTINKTYGAFRRNNDNQEPLNDACIKETSPDQKKQDAIVGDFLTPVLDDSQKTSQGKNEIASASSTVEDVNILEVSQVAGDQKDVEAAHLKAALIEKVKAALIAKLKKANELETRKFQSGEDSRKVEENSVADEPEKKNGNSKNRERERDPAKHVSDGMEGQHKAPMDGIAVEKDSLSLSLVTSIIEEAQMWGERKKNDVVSTLEMIDSFRQKNLSHSFSNHDVTLLPEGKGKTISNHHGSRDDGGMSASHAVCLDERQREDMVKDNEKNIELSPGMSKPVKLIEKKGPVAYERKTKVSFKTKSRNSTRKNKLKKGNVEECSTPVRDESGDSIAVENTVLAKAHGWLKRMAHIESIGDSKEKETSEPLNDNVVLKVCFSNGMMDKPSKVPESKKILKGKKSLEDVQVGEKMTRTVHEHISYADASDDHLSAPSLDSISDDENSFLSFSDTFELEDDMNDTEFLHCLFVKPFDCEDHYRLIKDLRYLTRTG